MMLSEVEVHNWDEAQLGFDDCEDGLSDRLRFNLTEATRFVWKASLCQGWRLWDSLP